MMCTRQETFLSLLADVDDHVFIPEPPVPDFPHFPADLPFESLGIMPLDLDIDFLLDTPSEYVYVPPGAPAA